MGHNDGVYSWFFLWPGTFSELETIFRKTANVLFEREIQKSRKLTLAGLKPRLMLTER